MSETKKTVICAAVAIVLVLLAVATKPRVTRGPSVFDDTGEPFYPELTDASVPKALEVIEFDEELGEAKPFRVQFKDGRWTIPSHHDYPADAEDRLADTAGSIIGLRKDAIAPGNKDMFADFGVVDPFEPGAASSGWGTRVKLFDKAGNVVTDLIFGKDVEDKTGFKYVRIPGQDRVYITKCDQLDLSTKFADWIDRDLLEVSSWDLETITEKDYFVDLDNRKNPVQNRGTLVLSKSDDSKWVLQGLKESEETNEDKARDVANAIADLKIVGVREKPPGLKPDLRVPEGMELAISMQARGFYTNQRTDEVISNDGEVLAETKEGLVYTLRFGNMIVGKGDEVTAGSEKEETAKPEKAAKKADEKKADKKEGDKKDGDASKKEEEKDDSSDLQENRFLLVSVSFNEAKFPPIPDPEPSEKAKKADDKKADGKAEKKADDKKADEKAKKEKTAEEKKAEEEKKKAEEELKRKREERQKKIDDGKKKAKELTDRFAQWYYVIENDAFKKIRLGRADLAKEKEKKEEDKDKEAKDKPSSPPAKTPAEKKPAAAKTADKKPAAKTPEKATTKPAVKAAKKEAAKPTAKTAPAKPADKASPKAKSTKPAAPAAQKEAPKSAPKAEPAKKDAPKPSAPAAKKAEPPAKPAAEADPAKAAKKK